MISLFSQQCLSRWKGYKTQISQHMKEIHCIRILCLLYSLLVLQARDLHVSAMSHGLYQHDRSRCVSAHVISCVFPLVVWIMWMRRSVRREAGPGRSGWDNLDRRGVRQAKRLTVWSFSWRPGRSEQVRDVSSKTIRQRWLNQGLSSRTQAFWVCLICLKVIILQKMLKVLSFLLWKWEEVFLTWCLL